MGAVTLVTRMLQRLALVVPPSTPTAHTAQPSASRGADALQKARVLVREAGQRSDAGRSLGLPIISD